MRRSLAIWAALLIGGGPACLLRLDDEVACGDGFVDQRAGEQCEPSIPSSYENECPGLGVADCDPVTCQWINDRSQCAICGDGMVDVDKGEECDGDTFNGNACPGGNGALQCTSDCMLDFSQCDACGNGVVDEGEECDYANNGGFATERPCAGSVDEEVPPLASPNKPYASGTSSLCGTDCRWDRSGCGFCGDGVRDDSTPVQGGVSSPPEWCDDEKFDDVRLASEFGVLCQDNPDARPAVTCGDDCQSFVEVDNGCCLRANASCPELGLGKPGGPGGGDGADTGETDGGETETESEPTVGDEQAPPLPCCWAVAHPEDDDPCYTSFEADGSARRLCR